MKVAFLEDPACSWCWAFQPIETAFFFEYGHEIEPRRVMGGLRDFPIPDTSFALRHWSIAGEVSGMPFDAMIWKEHVLQTTFLACRAVKAAQLSQPELVDRFLRRLREAFYVERTPIDDLKTVCQLGEQVGIAAGKLRGQLAGGQADSAFRVDRRIAGDNGFGFPTILIRPVGGELIALRGLVPYADICTAIADAGFSQRRRRRFHHRPEDWQRLFALRERLTSAELELVTGLAPVELDRRVQELRLERDGVFYVPGPAMLQPEPEAGLQPEARSPDCIVDKPLEESAAEPAPRQSREVPHPVASGISDGL